MFSCVIMFSSRVEIHINIILGKIGGVFFLFRENMPPQDAEIGYRNSLKQTNKTKQVSYFQSA